MNLEIVLLYYWDLNYVYIFLVMYVSSSFFKHSTYYSLQIAKIFVTFTKHVDRTISEWITDCLSVLEFVVSNPATDMNLHNCTDLALINRFQSNYPSCFERFTVVIRTKY